MKTEIVLIIALLAFFAIAIKINNYLQNKLKDKYEISFVENVFTTELSNLHAPNTKDAKKQEKFSQELKIIFINF